MKHSYEEVDYYSDDSSPDEDNKYPNKYPDVGSNAASMQLPSNTHRLNTTSLGGLTGAGMEGLLVEGYLLGDWEKHTKGRIIIYLNYAATKYLNNK